MNTRRVQPEQIDASAVEWPPSEVTRVHGVFVNGNYYPNIEVASAQPADFGTHVETASIEDEAEPTLGMWIACACVFAAGAISAWYFF